MRTSQFASNENMSVAIVSGLHVRCTDLLHCYGISYINDTGRQLPNPPPFFFPYPLVTTRAFRPAMLDYGVLSLPAF